MTSIPLASRRVLVTGASSGIGARIAQACATAGAEVAVVARPSERLKAVAAAAGAHPVAADLRDPDAAGMAVTRAAEALGGLDAVVNNAGVARMGPIMGTTYADWRAMFDVNVLAVLAVTQASVPHLRAAGGGDLVNVSSMSGRRVPRAAEGVYCGTKFAVHAISDGLRQELHGDGIRVTVVAPGRIAAGADLPGPGESTADPLRIPEHPASVTPEQVGHLVVHVLGLPETVGIRELAFAPSAQQT